MEQADIIRGQINGYLQNTALQIRSGIDKSRKTVAFVSSSCQYRSQLGGLPDFFRENFNVVNIIGDRCEDAFEKRQTCHYLPTSFQTEAGEFETVMDLPEIDVMIKPDMLRKPELERTAYSSRARRMYLTHHILSYPMGFNEMRAFDFLPMPTKSAMASAISYLKTSNQSGSRICLVPAGYPRLDDALDKYARATSSVQPDAILYAPTLRSLSPAMLVNAAVGFDCEMIQMLLENFEEHVIWRPHPYNFKYNHPNIQAVLDRFAGHPRFVCDRGESTGEVYARSKLMVTDVSFTAYTYAFTTLKPVLFFSPYVAPTTMYSELAHNVGALVRHPGEFVREARRLVRDVSEFRQQIEAYRESTVYNVGRSRTYLAENMERLIAGKYPADWVVMDF